MKLEPATVNAVPKSMGVVDLISHPAVIPWFWIETLLLVGLTILTLVRAVQKTEVGYEDEAGFHYGSMDENNRRASRSAQPMRHLEPHSCLHSHNHENRTSSRHARTKTD
jgi:ABC-type nickel/cobalt efflux system permease component RcnA